MMWHRIGMWVVATIVASQGVWAGDAAPQVPRAARTLHAFDGADGRQPTHLLRLEDGTLFGSTTLGGPGASGVLYRIAPDGSFAIVHAFTDTPDGAIPQRLIRAQDGSIYGLAAAGGAFGAGAIFRVDADGTGFAYLTQFTGGADGAGPQFLMQAPDGAFYGTAGTGGTPPAGCLLPPRGTVFRMDASGAVTPLHTFCENIDGTSPNSVLLDPDGFLYGTTHDHGALRQGATGGGSVWRIRPDGSDFDLLHVFGPRTLNGDQPVEPNGIVLAPDGFFYGTSNAGGSASNGTIFRATHDGHIQTVHSFNGFATDGSDPESNLILGADGFFYGTASHSGLPPTSSSRFGTVFRADTTGRVWVLHTYRIEDGALPDAPPVLGSDGRVYATAIWLGPEGEGVTTEIRPERATPVAQLVFAPAKVQGGGSARATLTLSRPAPAGGVKVKLFTSNSLAMPQSVTVPAGERSVRFRVDAEPVSVKVMASVTAYVGSVGMTAPLEVRP